MDKYFNNPKKDNPDFIRKINILDFLAKVLEINIRFLRNFSNTYEEDLTISATLARGIFELHLIFLEAISNNTNFLKVMIKGNLAYESFLEKFLQIAEQKGDQNAIFTFQDELVRIGLWRKKFEKLFNADLKPKRANPYFSFKKLAENHDLSDVYNIEYNILSSFIHPSLLYLITTESRDKTASKEKRELAKLNIEGRKRIVKKFAVNVAFGISSRTNLKVKEIIPDFL